MWKRETEFQKDACAIQKRFKASAHIVAIIDGNYTRASMEGTGGELTLILSKLVAQLVEKGGPLVLMRILAAAQDHDHKSTKKPKKTK